tara:strand:- start:24 stop:1214 length:1191 start_codon:yes stop_codon:yes gene_type:complete
MLREARSLLINVETRFLDLRSGWFEEIGVDLDMYFNTSPQQYEDARAVNPNAKLKQFFDTNGKLKDAVVYGSINSPVDADTGDLLGPYNAINTGATYAQPNVTNTNWDYVTRDVNVGNRPQSAIPITNQEGWGPIGVVQNSLSLVESIAGAALSPGTLGGTVIGAAPALGLNIEYLDDIQVDLLVKATQADQRSIELDAPRLTFYNGQGAWVSFTEEEAYVASLTAVTGEGSGGFEPDIQTLQTGVVLWLKGAASADRRYVTMNVYFQKGELVAIGTSTYGGSAGGGFNQAGGFQGSIQLPTVKVQQLFVTTSVPDKGTALLGGQRRREEYETEAGVPILSKIPYINRFFTNRITSTEEKTLLILLRPEIIIQTENEDILFPGLSDDMNLGASYAP